MADPTAHYKNDGRALVRAIRRLSGARADRLGADPKTSFGVAAASVGEPRPCCNAIDDGDDARGPAQKRNVGVARFECVTSCVSEVRCWLFTSRYAGNYGPH